MSTLDPTRGAGEAPHLSGVTPAEDARTILINNVSWGAIFAGAVIALMTLLLLNMLGLGLGVSSVTPSGGDNPDASTLSLAAGAWYVVSSLLAAFVGGYTAARLSGRAKGSTGAWHGLTTWAVTTLVVVYLLTTAVGSLIGGAFSTVTGAIGGVGHAAGTAASAAGPNLAGSDPFSAVANQLGPSGSDVGAAKSSALDAIKGAVTGNQAQADQAKETAVQALAKQQNIPVDDARAKVNQAQQQYQQTLADAKQKALQAADATATVVSRGALFGFVALVLGALAGWFGGRFGAVDPTVTERRDVRVATRP